MKISELLQTHSNIRLNPSRKSLIQDSVNRKEAKISKCGALATFTPPESTGRSPKDTYIVKNPESEKTIDWTSPYCIPMQPKVFEQILQDALLTLSKKETLYVTDRVLSADLSYALPLKAVTDHAITALFTNTMFREVPKDLSQSCFKKEFTLLNLPYDKLDKKYKGKLRSNIAVVMDFDNLVGVMYGSAYCGSIKKLMFTVMNYLLPVKGILPLHSSANESKTGASALLLGLSGTGKTTLSADPNRKLLGDDEHGWSDQGIANFENGCYAKLINLRKEKEPDIFNAVFHKDDYLKHGVIVENAKMLEDGTFDLDDDTLTQNSRASYPLSYLSNIKNPPTAGHPKTILFLTADANGVLPPVSKLSKTRAMLWFLMGYTSKLAGTETGVVDPVSTFSRFFGEPFLPRPPTVYIKLLGEKMDKHNTNVYLINTGWTGGPYGIGKRIDISLTRKMLNCALNGDLEKVEYEENDFFHLAVPKECPSVSSKLLNPSNAWENQTDYNQASKKLAQEFKKHFNKTYKDKVSKEIEKECPGY
jgi:phosphoenolpyruvate carboxykinase (ATP)